MHSSQIISLHCCNTLPVPDDLEILHVGVSVECKFRGNFKAEWAVLPPGSNVAAIPDDAIGNAKSFFALELCWWWLLIEHSLCPRRHLYILLCPRRPRCSCVLFVIYIPCVPVAICVPVVICVPVSQSIFSLWVSRSSFIFPLSWCPGRHLYPVVPVSNFSLSVPVVIYIPGVPVIICVPVSQVVTSSYNDVIYKALYTCNDVITNPLFTKKQTCIHRRTK